VVGNITLTATYAGDSNFNGSSGTAAHEVDYSVTISPPKSPANLGSSIPIVFQVKGNQGVVISDLSVVLLIESVYNGSHVPPGGCVASSSGTHVPLYQNPNFSTGQSSLRFVSSSYQFNWDSTSAQGLGCYTALIYLKDSSNPRMTTPIQLK
jgi:hypothetical protein